MEDTQTLEQQVDKFSDRIGGLFTEAVSPIGSKLDEIKESLQPKPESGEEVASMEAGGAVSGITNLKVWDIPIGQAVVGGFVAVVASELIDGWMASQTPTVKGLVKLVGAGAAVKWGTGLLGKAGATAVAILLAYDGIRMILPIDEWANKLASGATGLTGGGLGGRAGMKDTTIVREAEAVAGGYYDKAFGR